ncbi:MAG: cytochrome C [Proteobacteria bacterium]|nr:cytochrome C [Pseudomonadota bacterium]
MNVFLKVALLCSLSVYAWGSEEKLDKVVVEKDLPSIERGAEALMNSCHSCHSLKYIKYRDLIAFGISKQKVDGWRGEQPLDTPLMAQMSEADAEQAFSTKPPDLSLMTKARDGDENYLYSYLLAYYTTAEGVVSNHIFPTTKMPDPLGMSGSPDAAQHAVIEGQARDIVSFLSWAADPHEAERLQLGKYIIGYLLVLTALFYLVKKQIWARLK